MAQVDFTLTSNADAIKEATEEAIHTALKAVGVQAASNARTKIDSYPAIDTGRLWNSIESEVEDHTVLVGTNVEYGIYVEFGTGQFAENGGGRSTPWSWKDRDGNWHTTIGMHPRPFLRPAIEDNLDDYKSIFEEELSKIGN